MPLYHQSKNDLVCFSVSLSYKCKPHQSDNRKYTVISIVSTTVRKFMLKFTFRSHIKLFIRTSRVDTIWRVAYSVFKI